MDTRDRSSRLTEPCDLSATEARALIGAKQLSPVELTQSCIAPHRGGRSRRQRDGRARLRRRARGRARRPRAQVMRGDALGALHGLPLGVKDLIDAAGLPTTYGSPIFKDHDRQTRTRASSRRCARPARSSSARPTRPNGARAPTRATPSTARPAIRSIRRKSAAGSSGGSGVALACGMVPLATGSDTGGSLPQSGGVLRRRRLPADARADPEREAHAVLDPALGARADGAHRARPLPDALRDDVARTRAIR